MTRAELVEARYAPAFDKLRLTIVILIVILEKGVFFITVSTINFSIVTLSMPVLTKEVSKCIDKGSIEGYFIVF